MAPGVVAAVLVDVVRLLVYGTGSLAHSFDQSRGLLAPVVVATACAFTGSYVGRRMLKQVTLRSGTGRRGDRDAVDRREPRGGHRLRSKSFACRAAQVRGQACRDSAVAVAASAAEAATEAAGEWGADPETGANAAG